MGKNKEKVEKKRENKYLEYLKREKIIKEEPYKTLNYLLQEVEVVKNENKWDENS